VKDNLVPGSDCAGEILSVGEDVEDWKQGDKVCVHVSPAYIHGQPTAEAHDAFGGTFDGVLVEYKTFPAHV
jgi:NADPH:quinone reductase-like Zn-dependent oxidoreductase